ncbi:MAG TPA: RNA methyltransferase [Candidatus Saccharibacteria bacterium]|jgi:TrmH family RNA methyltransferase|nr:RNA methyltransferase [Candidatus Saccharibacteria bacterium]
MNLCITSTSNPKIKWIKSLHKNSTRRDEGVFIVEGAKEIAYAIDGGYAPRCMFICPEIFGEDLGSQFSELGEIITVSREVYEKIAYRGGTEGLLAVFEAKQKSLDELNFGENPFFLIIESVEKPGNLGAIIRTADGAGADGVIICDERTDIFNPNVIRSSVGTVFTKQVVTASSKDVYDFLERHEISAYGAILAKDSKHYTDADFSNPTALLLGTEHEGLSDFWKERSQPVVIPMLGSNDSLNVSNAAAVLAYEVVRQRAFVDRES